MTFDGNDLTISHTGLAVNKFESTDNHSRLRISSGDSSLTQLEFADQTDADAGEIRYDNANDRMTIHVGNNVERLRIESSGRITGKEPGTGHGMGGIIASTANASGNAGFGFMTAGTQRYLSLIHI